MDGTSRQRLSLSFPSYRLPRDDISCILVSYGILLTHLVTHTPTSSSSPSPPLPGLGEIQPVGVLAWPPLHLELVWICHLEQSRAPQSQMHQHSCCETPLINPVAALPALASTCGGRLKQQSFIESPLFVDEALSQSISHARPL